MRFTERLKRAGHVDSGSGCLPLLLTFANEPVCQSLVLFQCCFCTATLGMSKVIRAIYHVLFDALRACGHCGIAPVCALTRSTVRKHFLSDVCPRVRSLPKWLRPEWYAYPSKAKSTITKLMWPIAGPLLLLRTTIVVTNMTMSCMFRVEGWDANGKVGAQMRPSRNLFL